MSPRRGSGEQRQVNTLVMPPDKHISVPKDALLAAIKGRLGPLDAEVFDDLSKLMEGVASFDFFEVRERMRNSFLPFASGARNQTYLQRTSKGMPTTTNLNIKELDFVGDVFDVLRASHYHLLTTREWRIAVAESFRLTLPMEIEWEYMDGALMKRFWESSAFRKELRRHVPDEMADHILVFHRGVGTATMKGLLINEKLDLLCEYTVLRVLDKLWALVPAFLKGGKAAEPAAGAPAVARTLTKQRTLKASQSLVKQFSTLGGRVTGDQYVASDHKYAKVVERVTLKRLCPNVVSLLKNFPRPLELQEPTFKELVVVYRRACPPRKPPSAGSDAPNRTKEERMQSILNHRNIYIKVFGETPMADVEIIFPSKKVGVKPFQLVNLAATVIAALVTGGVMLWKAGREINMTILWTAASLVLTRIFQVYSQAQTQKSEMQQDMSSQLYDRMQDSQEGVVSVIMEEMGDQQFKQMVLAYSLLLLHEDPMLVDELDELCEDFLVKEFDERMDFQVDDALPRLEQWGLVTRGADDTVVARPIREAIETLTAAWSFAYKALGASRAVAVPTADLLSGRVSTFGASLQAWREGKDGAGVEAAMAARAGAAAQAKGLFTKLGASFGRGKGDAGAGVGTSGGGGGASGGGASGGGAESVAGESTMSTVDESEGGAIAGGASKAKKKVSSLFKRIKNAI